MSEATAKVEKALKSVSSQLSLIETKQGSESYACTMALKKAKDKLQGLASLDKALAEKRAAAEENERKLAAWQQELTQLQKHLEDRTKELNAREMQIDEYVPRIQMLEQEVAEARKLLGTQKLPPEVVAPKQEVRIEKSLPKLTEIEGELKRTASLLESRTYELIREERELHRKEAEFQAKQSALLQEQEKCLLLKSELEANQQIVQSSKQQIDGQLDKLKKLSLRKEAEVCSLWVLDRVISSASSTIQTRLVSHLAQKKQESSELIEQLEADIRSSRELQSALRRETEAAIALQHRLHEAEDRAAKKEAAISAELSLLKDGKAESLLKRREEAISAKEKAFNEKLKKLKETQEEVKRKEDAAEAMYEEAMRKLAECEGRPNVASVRFESILKPNPETDLRSKELQLDIKAKALAEREKLLADREDGIKQLQRSVESKQEKLKSLWSSLASAANLISRSKDQSFVASPPSEAEEPRAERSLSLSSIEPLDTCTVTSEVSNFTESFRVRQQQLIEHFADAERERLEMSKTLKEFLGADNVAVKW